MANGQPVCDGVNPGGKRVGRVEPVQFAVGDEEGVLQQILCLVVVAGLGQKKVVERFLELSDQRLE